MSRQYGAISGAAIILILLNHALHFGVQMSPADGGWLRVVVPLQALGGFAVPAFLFVSGAFLAYAGSALTLALIRTNVARILWPYVTWSVCFYLAEWLVAGVRDSGLGYVKSLVVGYPYHFVPLLIFWYVSMPLLGRLARRHGVLLLGTIGLWQVFLLMLRFPGEIAMGLEWPDWVRSLQPPVLFIPMSDWAIYFPLGLVLGMHASTARPVLQRLRPTCLVVTVALFVVGILDAFSFVSAPWARFAAPVPAMLVLPTIRRDSIPATRALEAIGRRSYGIYLVHFLVMMVSVWLVTAFVPWLASRLVLTPPLLFAAGLGVSWLTMSLLGRWTPGRRVYRYIFGIVPPSLEIGSRNRARPLSPRMADEQPTRSS